MTRTAGRFGGRGSGMNIGQAAIASGVSAKMIRYYERIGVVGSAARTHGNYRDFGPQEVSDLRFIRLARALCFTMGEIASLLSLWRNRDLPAEAKLQWLEDARQFTLLARQGTSTYYKDGKPYKVVPGRKP